MPILTFAGYVFPKGRNITFNDLPKMTFENNDLKVLVTPQIQNSVVTITCNLNRDLQGDELIRLYTRAHEAMRTTMDVYAFATGRGYTLVLSSYTNANGTTELVKTPH
jgi:hypothetical protein